jgi:hypothetical protein
LFAEGAWVESIVDFGHAKQIFEEADVFPSIVVVRKPDSGTAPDSVRACSIPREQLRIHDLSQQIRAAGFDLPRKALGQSAWMLEPPAVADLLSKIQRIGTPLREFAGVRPYRGVLTGLNEAFIIDSVTRDRLVREDVSCEYLIRPLARGQDVRRWRVQASELWLIAIESSADRQWPWSDAGDAAEDLFARALPSIHRHLARFKEAAIARQDKVRPTTCTSSPS